MAVRNLLHKSKLEEFKTWLEKSGHEILKCKGQYEVLRWRGEPSMPMPIVFEKGSSSIVGIEHYSCNNEAVRYVKKFIKQKGECDGTALV